MTATNLGRSINLVSGINGVSPGGVAIWNPPLNRRYHRKSIKCAGIALAGGTGLASTAVTGSGSGATFTYTANSAGTIAATGAITVAGGGTGYAVGDKVTISDPNYPAASGYVNPIVVTVATLSTSAIATITYTITAQPTQPYLVIGNGVPTLKVNGVVMRDISVAQTMGIILANPSNKSYSLQPGEFPILFTEPWRNVLRKNDLTSWDVFGQPTFEIDFPIATAVTSPSLTGNMEFDYQRNLTTANGKSVPFLQPVKYKAYSTAVPVGQYDWVTLPINFPISRIWLIGATPGQITRLEVYQDGNKVMESYTPEIVEQYGEYGFSIGGLTNTANSAATTWDAAYISDPDQRLGKSLKVQNSMILRIYSSVAQNVTAVMELLPGNYQ